MTGEETVGLDEVFWGWIEHDGHKVVPQAFTLAPGQPPCSIVFECQDCGEFLPFDLGRDAFGYQVCPVVEDEIPDIPR